MAATQAYRADLPWEELDPHDATLRVAPHEKRNRSRHGERSRLEARELRAGRASAASKTLQLPSAGATSSWSRAANHATTSPSTTSNE